MTKRLWRIGISVLLAVAAGWFMHVGGQSAEVSSMAGITVLMAALWITEAIPLGATSLLPVVLFPLFNIADAKEVTPLYAHHIVFLFIAGFFLAYAMEKWDLHRRIAFRIIGTVGFSATRVLIGFMLAAYLLSMWISNLATTVLLLSPALAVLQEWQGNQKRFGVALLLGISYAASIGGTATPIGTAPNLIFSKYWEGAFATQYGSITFLDWMYYGVPISFVLVVACFGLLWWRFMRRETKINTGLLQEKIAQLPKMRIEERWVLGAFVLLALLWMSKAFWVDWLATPSFMRDSAIGMLVVLLLFFIPSARDRSEHILEWRDTQKLPLDIIFIFGGGFALAMGFTKSGLDKIIAAQLEPMADWPLWVMVLGIGFFMTFLTEITSNTATTQLVLPLLVILAQSSDRMPLYFLLPATFAASFAFMLPVATPPNAIVFGTNKISLNTMMRTGLWLNLLAVLLMSLMVFLLV